MDEMKGIPFHVQWRRKKIYQFEGIENFVRILSNTGMLGVSPLMTLTKAVFCSSVK